MNARRAKVSGPVFHLGPGRHQYASCDPREADMGTLIHEALVWLLWQGLKPLHGLLKSEKMENHSVRPVLDAVV
jgi:hypothetical protein